MPATHANRARSLAKPEGANGGSAPTVLGTPAVESPFLGGATSVAVRRFRRVALDDVMAPKLRQEQEDRGEQTWRRRKQRTGAKRVPGALGPTLGLDARGSRLRDTSGCRWGSTTKCPLLRSPT